MKSNFMGGKNKKGIRFFFKIQYSSISFSIVFITDTSEAAPQNDTRKTRTK